MYYEQYIYEYTTPDGGVHKKLRTQAVYLPGEVNESIQSSQSEKDLWNAAREYLDSIRDFQY